ncbi:MAG: aldose 1-epimerase family protein [Acidimicrobiales bacterium]
MADTQPEGEERAEMSRRAVIGGGLAVGGVALGAAVATASPAVAVPGGGAVGLRPGEETLPTGRQYEIERHGTRAVVTEVGATLRVFEVDGRSYLDTFGPEDLVDAARGQVLIPFPNRVADGRYMWEGEEQQLPINEVARNNAIHGLIRWANWDVRHLARHTIVLGLVLHPHEGYPFILDLELTYVVERGRLQVQQRARNLGTTLAPYGVGFHPYLTVGTPTIDSNVLRLPAASYFLTDDRLIPTEKVSVEGTPFDFRAPRPIGDTQMDTGFTDILRDRDGRAKITLTPPDGPRLALFVGPGYEFLQVFTGDPLPEDRRRTGLAVEPYSCAANAFNNGMGLIRLEPGRRTTRAWALEVED